MPAPAGGASSGARRSGSALVLNASFDHHASRVSQRHTPPADFLPRLPEGESRRAAAGVAPLRKPCQPRLDPARLTRLPQALWLSSGRAAKVVGVALMSPSIGNLQLGKSDIRLNRGDHPAHGHMLSRPLPRLHLWLRQPCRERPALTQRLWLGHVEAWRCANVLRCNALHSPSRHADLPRV